jgi:hypothetical protein
VSIRTPTSAHGQAQGAAPFTVYVEGARDGEILRIWARRLSPPLSRALRRVMVILGGRRPERARSHLDALRDDRPGARGLCILDRDTGAVEVDERDGLQAFSWSRRHIESYLLVPAAIRRAAGFDRNQLALLDVLLREHMPEGADGSLASLDAKRLLGPKGPIAQELGRPLRAGRIARAMKEEELHPEVLQLLGRIGKELGFSLGGPHVTVRTRR